MKKLIFRKFIIDTLIFFTSSILIMGLIVWTLQAVNYFDFVSEDGHGLKVYFAYTALNFPKIIHRIFPFMFFISLFYTLIRYELNNELNIFWINGISKMNFIKVVIFFSITLMFFQIFLGSYLSPMTQLKGRNFIKNSNVDFFTSLIKEGKFINAVKGLTIFIEENNEENFSNIFIDDSSKGYSRMIYAKNGVIVSEKKKKKFVLFDGKVINIDKSRINTFEFDQIDFNLESFSSNSIIQPKIQETSSVHLLSCVFYEKFSLQKECRYNDLSEETKQELLKRFYKPFYIPVIALLCSFLLISGNYKPNYSSVKKYVFLIILLVLITSEASLRYSTKSSFSMIIYFLVPLVLFLSFYISIHKKIKNV